MNRKLWTQELREYFCPAWTCPVCKHGTFNIIPKSLVYKETAESKQYHGHDEWEPDWTEYIFTAWAKCGNQPCGQELSISGSGGVDEYPHPDEGYIREPYFKPKLCIPMPDIISLSDKCPKEVSKELREAFKLFWLNRAACAGRIRTAIERLMDHLKVPKKRKNKNGKFFNLTLHDRIEDYRKENTEIADRLMALKWLGNTGTHDDRIEESEILDGFEILEWSLEEIIEQRSHRVSILTKKITKKHGF